MAVYRVHSEPVRYSYYAPIISFAMVLQLIILGLLIALPFIIAYASAGMWVYQRCYYQQPSVMFKHEAYITMSGSSSFSQLSWSTSAEYNRIVQKQLRVPTLRSFEEDSNNDGTYDWLQFDVEMPLEAAESIDSVSVALIFDYQLHYMADVTMETMAYYHFTGSGSGSSLTTDGDLVLTQTEPFPWRGSRNQYNVDIVDTTSNQASSYDFATIAHEYMNRNETTSYEHVVPVWKADRALGQPFQLSMRVRYRPQQICYRPGFWQELKWGWVQYVAILIPLVYFTGHIRWFIFGNQLVETIVRNEEIARFKAHGE
mmetsp:Transcript_12428/g.31813  ORF Transcript_12428/g.31813 Transcript_12428/m.31813 type:complete len:314 (-) Transcript_12428:275-1216(-)